MGDCLQLDKDVLCALLAMMPSVSLEALKLSDEWLTQQCG